MLLLPPPAAAQSCNEPTHLVTSSDAACRAYCTGLAERAGLTADPNTYEGAERPLPAAQARCTSMHARFHTTHATLQGVETAGLFEVLLLLCQLS